MNLIVTQQVALENALVAPEKRLKIEKRNARIEFSKPQREETYQVTLDDLKLSPCYPAFLITAKVCPILHNQDFVEPPSKEEMVSFIQELSYSSKCDMISAIQTDQMHKPWRTYAIIINKCIFGKSPGLDRLRPSRAQILGFRVDYGFVATLDDEIRRDPQREDTDEIYVRLDDAQDERLLMSGQLNILRRDRRDHVRTTTLMVTEAKLSRQAWVQSMDASDTARAEVASLHTTVLAQQSEIAARDADRSRNGKDSHDSGMGARRQAPSARECTYQDFMKCKPLYSKSPKLKDCLVLT
nr:hypothetical protein [Tanacetum cinerariifolium]